MVGNTAEPTPPPSRVSSAPEIPLLIMDTKSRLTFFVSRGNKSTEGSIQNTFEGSLWRIL